jgi:hypothetical protein
MKTPWLANALNIMALLLAGFVLTVPRVFAQGPLGMAARNDTRHAD